MVISDSVAVEQTAEISADLIKVCITGKLSSGTKSVFLKKYADKIVEADVKTCDYLIANEDKGSAKYKQAIKLGKEIVTESEFLEKIK
jgi:NAD-dependent DNA ligase